MNLPNFWLLLSFLNGKQEPWPELLERISTSGNWKSDSYAIHVKPLTQVIDNLYIQCREILFSNVIV